MRWITGKRQCLSGQLPRNFTRLAVKKRMLMDECKVHKVWIVLECEYATKISQDRLYLSKVWKARRQKIRQFLKKTAAFMFRLSATTALTYLYSMKAIESAYLARGYTAYGGEYLMIPFVFYAIFKALGSIGVLCSGMFRKNEERR